MTFDRITIRSKASLQGRQNKFFLTFVFLKFRPNYNSVDFRPNYNSEASLQGRQKNSPMGQSTFRNHHEQLFLDRITIRSSPLTELQFGLLPLKITFFKGIPAGSSKKKFPMPQCKTTHHHRQLFL